MARAESAHTTIASVTDAHAHLIQRIITNKPHHMPGWHLADALDFEDRAEHLRRLLAAVEDYTRAVLVDMKRSSSVYVDTDAVHSRVLADFRAHRPRRLP
jgi:hypothetical protein